MPAIQLDPDQLKLRLQSLRQEHRSYTALARPGRTVPAELRLHGQAGGLAGTGAAGQTLAADELARLREANRARIDQLRAGRQAAALASPAGRALPAQAAAWRARARRLASPHGEPSLNFVVLDTPGLILPYGDIYLQSVKVEPWNNVVRFDGHWESSGIQQAGGGIDYIFAWQNPADTQAIINVDSYLTVRGSCDVYAAWGLNEAGGRNSTELALGAGLTLFLNDPNLPDPYPPYESGQHQTPFDLFADGGGLFGVGDYESSAIGTIADVSYHTFVIPPLEPVVFVVSLGAGYATTGGWGDLDLSSGDGQVVCPGLVLAIVG